MRGVETFRRVLVCGSRDWTDYELLARTLGEFPACDGCRGECDLMDDPRPRPPEAP